MNPPLFLLIFSVVATSSFGVLWAGWRYFERDRKTQIRERLATPEQTPDAETESVTILQEEQGGAWKLRFKTWALSQVDAAGLKWSTSKVLGVCAACAIVGAFLGLRQGRKQ